MHKNLKKNLLLKIQLLEILYNINELLLTLRSVTKQKIEAFQLM